MLKKEEANTERLQIEQKVWIKLFRLTDETPSSLVDVRDE